MSVPGTPLLALTAVALMLAACSAPCATDADCAGATPHCGADGACRALAGVHGPCEDNSDCVSRNCHGAGTPDGVCTDAAGAPCSGFCLDTFACAVAGNTCEQSCRTDTDCAPLVTPVSGATHRPCVRYPGQPPGETGWCRYPCGTSSPGAPCPTGWICDPWTPPAGSEWPSPAHACAPI